MLLLLFLLLMLLVLGLVVLPLVKQLLGQFCHLPSQLDVLLQTDVQFGHQLFTVVNHDVLLLDVLLLVIGQVVDLHSEQLDSLFLLLELSLQVFDNDQLLFEVEFVVFLEFGLLQTDHESLVMDVLQLLVLAVDDLDVLLCLHQFLYLLVLP